MFKEAALTEILNKKSLEFLTRIENERTNQNNGMKRDRFEDEPYIRYKQSFKNGLFSTNFSYPSEEYYAKNFRKPTTTESTLAIANC